MKKKSKEKNNFYINTFICLKFVINLLIIIIYFILFKIISENEIGTRPVIKFQSILFFDLFSDLFFDLFLDKMRNS